MLVIKMEINPETDTIFRAGMDPITDTIYYGSITVNGKNAGTCSSRIPANLIEILAKIATHHPDCEG
jgi:hypothetical protein